MASSQPIWKNFFKLTVKPNCSGLNFMGGGGGGGGLVTSQGNYD